MKYNRRIFIRMLFVIELSLVMGICLYGIFHIGHKSGINIPTQVAEAGEIDSDQESKQQEEEIITDKDCASNGKGGPYKMAPALRFSTYHVKNGENVLYIAKKNKLDFFTILTANKLNQANALTIGQKIKIPNQRGIMHTVGEGETLEDIALTYNASLRKIIRVNRILDPSEIKKGSDLFIPGAKITIEFSKELLKTTGVEEIQEFIWPCKINRSHSSFGYRTDPFYGRRAFHYGLDLTPGNGTPVSAAKDGIVTYAGWMGGYGKLVVIQHSDNYSTRYGHLSQILVSKGQRVRQSNTLGYVGSTGRSTGPHLHFEVREDGKALNPFKILGK
jgi:LysM repeat protein